MLHFSLKVYCGWASEITLKGWLKLETQTAGFRWPIHSSKLNHYHGSMVILMIRPLNASASGCPKQLPAARRSGAPSDHGFSQRVKPANLPINSGNFFDKLYIYGKISAAKTHAKTPIAQLFSSHVNSPPTSVSRVSIRRLCLDSR